MWLYRDLGKPLVGPKAASILMDLMPNNLKWETRLHLSELAGSERVNHSVSFLVNHAESSKEKLTRNLDRLPGGHVDYLGNAGFCLENFKYSFDVELRDLPWSNKAWTQLVKLGFEENTLLIKFDSLQWRELFHVGDLDTLLEVLHTVYDWAEFAVREELLVPRRAALSQFAQFTNDILSARAGDIFRSNEKLRNFIVNRFGFGSKEKTLEQIGREIGLSRERVRQIESRFLRQFAHADIKPPPYLLDLLSPAKGRALSKKNSNWTQEAKDILGVLYLGSWYRDERIRLGLLEDEKNLENKVLSKEIQKYRSKIGVLRLSELEEFRKSKGLTQANLKSLIKIMYPRSIFSQDVVIARNQKNEPIILTSINRQLRTANPLPLEVLLTGLQRVAILRKCQNYIPTFEELYELLSGDIGYEIDDQFLVNSTSFSSQEATKNLQVELQEDYSVTDWIVNQLRNCKGQVSQKSTLVRMAARSGIKFGTVTMSIQYAPEFRIIKGQRGKEGQVYLVGSNPTLEDLQFAEALANLKYEAGLISDIKIIGEDSFSFRCVFSTQLMVSGVLAVNPQVGRLLGEAYRKVSCCESFASSGQAKLSNNSLLAGLAALREHLWHTHSVQEGDSFRLVCTAGEIQVSLN